MSRKIKRSEELYNELYSKYGNVQEILKKREEQGLIQSVEIKNEYEVYKYKGTNNPITSKWNITCYTGRKAKTIVTNDEKTLIEVIENNYFTNDGKILVKIDDSGWGYPIGGVLSGIEYNNKIYTCETPVEYFRGRKFKDHKYLQYYSDITIEKIKELGIDKETHRIDICTGYCNTKLKDDLRELGFEVNITEIEGLLQDKLEEEHRKYVKELISADIYYDPKEMDKDDIPRQYHKVRKFALKNCSKLMKWE